MISPERRFTKFVPGQLCMVSVEIWPDVFIDGDWVARPKNLPAGTVVMYLRALCQDGNENSSLLVLHENEKLWLYANDLELLS